MENIVRPFQLPNTANSVRIQQAGQREVKRVLLQFGRAGSGRMMTGNSTLNVSFYCVKYVVEKDEEGGGGSG